MILMNDLYIASPEGVSPKDGQSALLVISCVGIEWRHRVVDLGIHHGGRCGDLYHVFSDFQRIRRFMPHG